MAKQSKNFTLCKDCEFWDNTNIPRIFPKSLKGKYGDCKNDAFVYEYPDNGRTDMLVYSDQEGFSACVVTGENFGCVHGRRKGMNK